VRGLIRIRDAAQQVLKVNQENGTDEELQKAQAELNWVYNSFVPVHGPIHAPGNRRAFADDPALPFILGTLEDFDSRSGRARKTMFFTQRVIGAVKIPDRECCRNGPGRGKGAGRAIK
jgi:N12 class adenine-specific DNA methylase